MTGWGEIFSQLEYRAGSPSGLYSSAHSPRWLRCTESELFNGNRDRLLPMEGTEFVRVFT